MKYHQMMSLFAAPEDIYYPAKEAVISGVGWGASTDIAETEFPTGVKHAIIRSIFIPPTTVTSAPFPIVEILDGAGDTVFFWTLSEQVSGEQLLGPDGIKVPGGFSIEVSGADGGYIAVTYDIA
jgi:hypothetical protein